MKLLISRRLPESVMQEAEARFDVTCRGVTTPMDHGECVDALKQYDAVLPTLGDPFRAEAFAAVPEPRWRISASVITTLTQKRRARRALPSPTLRAP
jgi:gluconate 2-dehydrogenase